MDLPAIISCDFSAGKMDLISCSEAQTVHFGRLLAEHLLTGDVVSLDGSLGAGKTVLTKGIAEGLGCRGPVSSPTFILLIEHPPGAGGMALYHFDAYRLSSSLEFTAAGLDEYFDSNGICVVEWGSRVAKILPGRTLRISLCPSNPELPGERRINIYWPGQQQRLEDIAAYLPAAVQAAGQSAEQQPAQGVKIC